MIRFVVISLSATLLAACGEVDQTQSANRHQPDVQPWKGAHNVYVAQGWTPGDKNAWEKHLRERQQHQNEYLKVD
ncbi:MAG: hypothetical protein V7642_7099 [Burkholderiales bacterium]|jgi:hypothetical protein